MEKETIKQIILSRQQLIANISLIRRDMRFERDANYVLVGMRRAGKSYLLYQQIQSLVAEGVPIERMLFVNFEDERLTGMKMSELHLILDAYAELFEYDPIIFLDEIQVVEGWEHFARRLADEKRRVYVTGSNSHMLSREIASTLGGRYLIKEVFPFSFREYLEFQGITLSKNWLYDDTRNAVVRNLNDYLEYGGLSECFTLADKRSWLTSLYSKIIYGDIVIHGRIRNETGIKLLTGKIADSVMQPVSVRRMTDLLKATGVTVTRETVGNYLNLLKEGYLIFPLNNHAAALSERESIKKYYFYDNGILNLFLINPTAKLLENLVAITLLRRYGEEVGYYSRNVEVDFIVPSRGEAIQVSLSMDRQETYERQTKALAAVAAHLHTRRNIIVTLASSGGANVGEVPIEIVPIWRWLLEE